MRSERAWMRLFTRAAVSTTFGLMATHGVGYAASLTPVLQANPKTPGIAVPNVLSVELTEQIVAQGSNPVENPMSVDLGNGTLTVPFYGYDGDGPHVPLAGDAQTPEHNVEAKKTEPDKNTYLVVTGQHGADPSYDYGTHFLYQGHEGGPTDPNNRTDAALTRINLDADGAHRVTLLAIADVNGNSIPAIDGSTWDPFAQRLLFTAEQGSLGGVWEATLDFPSAVEALPGSLGHASYEGLQNDEDGNLWIVEDAGGATGATNDHARQPNSFLYRFVPDQPDDLKHGKLQALRVFSARTGQPIVFHPGQADADILSDDVHDLHTYGKVFSTRWITIHDTTVDTVEFNANALAKAAGATPFKRPENGQFHPGSHFTEFFFDETGDTDARTQAGSAFGGFGAIFKLTQSSPSADTGQLTLFYLGDLVHAAFDNVAFWSRDEVVFVEDAGDTLHTQRNALDSAWMLDVNVDYSVPSEQPIRILAQGRDASATIDSSLGSVGGTGFQNDGDNEITGIHVSDGDPSVKGILGAKQPHLFRGKWRAFYTQQHGDNVTWEIVASRASRSH